MREKETEGGGNGEDEVEDKGRYGRWKERKNSKR